MTFTVLVLLAGLIPILIFWVERQVTARVRRENPELRPPPEDQAFLLGRRLRRGVALGGCASTATSSAGRPGW